MKLSQTLLALLLSSSCALTSATSTPQIPYRSAAAQYDLPELGRGVGLIDQQQEKYIGEKVLRQVQAQMPVLHDPWLEDQLMVVFSHILSQTQLGQPIALVLVRDAQVNAFAVPGGLFAMNTGLITTAQNMDEVAGVMAHEIAHVAQRHYNRSQEAFKGQGLLALAGVLVGAVIATQTRSEAGPALMYGTQAALLDRQLAYSRDQEREADRVGMQFMYTAGYNPESMADFFEIMHRSSNHAGFFPDFWLTHPLSTERMSEARLRARQFPQAVSLQHLTEQDFQIIRWRTAVLSKQIDEGQLKEQAGRQNYAALLALATYNVQQGNYNEAQRNLDLAKKIQPLHTLIALIQTDIDLGRKNLDAAYKDIASAQRVMPENRALTYKLAEVYIRKHQGGEALKLLQPFTQNNPRDIVGWQLMQQAATQDANLPDIKAINVLRYRAEVEYWSGAEESAIKSLLHAQRLAKGNESLSARVDSRLKQMQQERKMKI